MIYRGARRTATVLLLGLVALAVPATVRPLPARAAADVQAEVTYREAADGSVGDVRLIVYRDGSRVLDRAPVTLCRTCPAIPFPQEEPESAARVIQLDRSPEPEVLFTLYAGGAHCCVYVEIFRWDSAAGRYLVTMHDFRDPGYQLKGLGHTGVPVFASADDRFAYRFSCFACSRLPPQVWEYRAGRMVDVTSSFPGQVKTDLVRLERSYRRARGRADVRPVLAALVADECVLGRCASGFRVVRQARQRGYVRVFDHELEFGPHGRKFVRVLRRFLTRLGYLSGSG